MIETAEVGAADYLITGDSDLLDNRTRASLGRIGIGVITARDFLHGSLASLASSAIVIDQARTIVAAEVSAIASSASQVATLSRRLDSFIYDVMIAAATIKRRIAMHKTELAELESCGEGGTAVVSSLGVQRSRRKLPRPPNLYDARLKQQLRRRQPQTAQRISKEDAAEAWDHMDSLGFGWRHRVLRRRKAP